MKNWLAGYVGFIAGVFGLAGLVYWYYTKVMQDYAEGNQEEE